MRRHGPGGRDRGWAETARELAGSQTWWRGHRPPGGHKCEGRTKPRCFESIITAARHKTVKKIDEREKDGEIVTYIFQLCVPVLQLQ